MRLVFSPCVESDLGEIAACIAADDPVCAAVFIDEIAAHLKVIADNPRMYRLRPEIGQ
jgi:plasmid stabilization system protein ParE